MEFKKSIFYKNLRALYKLNLGKSNEVHRIIITALWDLFVLTKGDIDQAKLQMCLKTATGEWLDAWGDYFNIPRELNETDEVYSQRIIDETIEPKVTLNAIKASSARWLNRTYGDSWEPEDISIMEPWKYLLKPSQRGTLSGAAKIMSADYWTYGVIDISLPNSTQLTYSLVSYLNTIKAAGVKIMWSIRPSWDVIVGYWEHTHAYLSIDRILNLRSKPFYKTFMIWSDIPFLGMDDSNYQSKLSGNPEFKLSGQRLLWSEMVERHRDLQQVNSARDYEGSAVTSLSDYSNFSEKPYETTTIGDMLDLETEEYNRLKKSLGIIVVTNKSLTQTYINFANNIRKLSHSPIAQLVIAEGFEIDQRVQNFLYDDPEDTYYQWLSLQHISELMGVLPSVLTLENIVENRNSIINSLIWEEAIMDNILAPVQVTNSPA